MAQQDDELSAVMGDLESAMHAATAQVRADLERARAGVHDAVERLNRSLRALELAATGQRAVLQSVVAALRDDGHNKQTLAASSEALLRQFIDEVVRVSCDSMRIIEQLTQLTERVDSIVGCADSIDGLARETRFIAFNARIETHRAGDAGRTFKVVADEVKRLANASSALSNEIRQNVSDCRVQLSLVNKASTGLALHDMSKAMESHRQLTEAVGKLDEVNGKLGQTLQQLERHALEALQALAFEEALSQLFSATIKRVERIGALSLEACKLLAYGKNGQRSKPLRELVQHLFALTEGPVAEVTSAEVSSADPFDKRAIGA